MIKAFISVIIPVRNEAAYIGGCLGSLKKQTVEHEVVVVDDGSTDATAKVVAGSPEVKYCYQVQSGPGPARNLGARQAKGQVLVFVDADMTFEPNFLENLVAPICQGKVSGTFTTDEKVANWENVWARCWNFEYLNQITRFRVPQDQKESPVFRAILKKVFLSVNGFSGSGYDDDHSLSAKLGIKAIRASGATIYHANPDTLTAVFRQAAFVATRSYKLGEWGRIWAWVRANPVFSLITGGYKGILSHELAYPVFKLVYNAGITYGIMKYWLGLCLK